MINFVIRIAGTILLSIGVAMAAGLSTDTEKAPSRGKSASQTQARSADTHQQSMAKGKTHADATAAKDKAAKLSDKQKTQTKKVETP